jgi:hypothetical protein
MHFASPDSAFIPASNAQIGPERQRSGPASHTLDKRSLIAETQPNPVRQEARENPFSFALGSFLHRNRCISCNATPSREELG